MYDQIKKNFAAAEFATWEQLPDLELYKDQVLGYMQRQFVAGAMAEDEILTGAMINNYIKDGVMPRPNGKKYGKEHLAVLTAVCALKPVLSISDIEKLLKNMPSYEDKKELYSVIVEMIGAATAETVTVLENIEDINISEKIMETAILASMYKTMCERLIKLLRETEKSDDTGKEKDEVKQKAKKDKNKEI